MSKPVSDIPRELIEQTIAITRAATDRGDWNTFVDCFADDGRFMNSALSAPVAGKEAIRTLANSWPRVVNLEEWRVIDGGRFAIGWNERHYDSPADDIYRGMSTFTFDAEGRIVDYEGVFDLSKVVAAYQRVASKA